jgi:hypothetical protein
MADETVKVRVAVAVDAEGDWNACGWSKGAGKPPGAPADPAPGPDSELAEAACEHVREGERVFYLTAELPIPKRPGPAEVAAGVEDAT